jgi:hypothetical protein
MNGVDLNQQSDFVYGRVAAPPPIGERIDALVNEALLVERDIAPPRDYLGASRIGEPCARRLCYELIYVPADEGAALSGRILRIAWLGSTSRVSGLQQVSITSMVSVPTIDLSI